MELICQGLKDGFILLMRGDPEVVRITLLTLLVSTTAVIFALLSGIPAGIFLADANFPGRRLVVTLLNTGMGLPPVVVGLIIVIFFWRNGPFGFISLLYTPWAIVLAQFVIAWPIVTGLSMAAIQHLPPKLRLQSLVLGASKFQLYWTLFREAKLPLLAAVMAGFGSIISEVGAVMMVGGNIKGHTRVLTTSIVMETRLGHFEMALALCVVLFLLSFIVNLMLTLIQQRGRR